MIRPDPTRTGDPIRLGLAIRSDYYTCLFTMAIVPVSRKRVKMAPYGGKSGILHLSYLRSEFGDPNFFSVFTMSIS